MLLFLVVAKSQDINNKHVVLLKSNYSEADTAEVNAAILSFIANAPSSWDTVGLRLNDYLELCRKVNHWAGVYEINYYLNNYYYMRGDYANAIRVSQDNLDMAERMQDSKYRGKALLSLTENNLKSQNIAEAEKYLKKAFAAFETIHDTTEIALCNLKYSFLKFETGHYDSSYMWARKASVILKKTKLHDKYVSSLKMMAVSNMKMGNGIDALIMINRCIDVVKKHDINFDMAELYIDKAYIYNEMDDFKKAIYFGEQAHQIALKDSILREMMVAAELLTISYKGIGDFASALRYSELNKVYVQMLFDQNKMRDISNLNARYESIKNESENKHLKETADILAKQLKQQRTFLLLSTIGTLMVLLLLLAILRARQKLKKANSTFEKQNKTIELINTKLSAKLFLEEKHRNEIDLKNQELRYHIEMQNKLIYVISHDLISPFNALLGLSEILKLNFEKESVDKNRELINMLNNSAQSAYSLTRNLLTWIRSVSGNSIAKPTVVGVNELVEVVINSLSTVFESKNQIVSNQVSAQCSVMCDKNMLETVIRNLLQNASKFTPEFGKIHISSQVMNGHCNILVKDTGVGINKSDIEKLFSISNHEIESKDKGTGFGLLICKEFVEKNNGRIWAESQLNKGTTFVVELQSVQGITV